MRNFLPKPNSNVKNTNIFVRRIHIFWVKITGNILSVAYTYYILIHKLQSFLSAINIRIVTRI